MRALTHPSAGCSGAAHLYLTRTSVYDACSGSKKITTHLHLIRHCKTASGTYWLSRCTYPVFIIKTRRDRSFPRRARCPCHARHTADCLISDKGFDCLWGRVFRRILCGMRSQPTFPWAGPRCRRSAQGPSQTWTETASQTSSSLTRTTNLPNRLTFRVFIINT